MGCLCENNYAKNLHRNVRVGFKYTSDLELQISFWHVCPKSLGLIHIVRTENFPKKITFTHCYTHVKG